MTAMCLASICFSGHALQRSVCCTGRLKFRGEPCPQQQRRPSSTSDQADGTLVCLLCTGCKRARSWTLSWTPIHSQPCSSMMSESGGRLARCVLTMQQPDRGVALQVCDLCAHHGLRDGGQHSRPLGAGGPQPVWRRHHPAVRGGSFQPSFQGSQPPLASPALLLLLDPPPPPPGAAAQAPELGNALR